MSGMRLAGPSGRRLNTSSAFQIKLSSSHLHDVCKTFGTKIVVFDSDCPNCLSNLSTRSYGEIRVSFRLNSKFVSPRRICNAGAALAVQRLAESFVQEDAIEPKQKETEDLGQVIRRAQYSGHVRSPRKEAPKDILHNLAKTVALRVASENLVSDEDVMKVVNETGLRVDVRSMNIVVWQLGQMQNWHAATKVFRAFRSAGVEPNAYVCTSLIAALG